MLEVRQYSPEGVNVKKFGTKWAAQGGYYFNWIWGFDTKEDAQIVADALQMSADNATDAYSSSY
jgi:hypothetical protein